MPGSSAHAAALSLAALLAATPAAAQDPVAAVLDRLGARLATDVAQDDVGSISAAVVDGGRVIWANAYGWADRDARTPADTGNVYRTGSITKSLTAILLMTLVEDGTVALDEPVSRALPALGRLADRPASASDITYRHLASHTAGLIREPRLPGAAAGPIAGWEEKILASIPTTSYFQPPGRGYSYSNIGFGILGLALSRAAGRPYIDLVRERILDPLGMESSAFVVEPPLRRRLAAGYANRTDGPIDSGPPEREHAGRGYKVPNGGLYSTAGDLARLIAAMTGALGDTVLADTTRTEMFRLQTPGDSLRGYGIGFTVEIDSMGRRLVGHGGSVAGYNAYLLFEPESGLGIVLLRNYDSGATNLGATARATLQELLDARARAAPGPRASLQADIVPSSRELAASLTTGTVGASPVTSMKRARSRSIRIVRSPASSTSTAGEVRRHTIASPSSMPRSRQKSLSVSNRIERIRNCSSGCTSARLRGCSLPVRLI